MDWRESLGIEDSRWIGIGKYIATITTKALESQRKTSSDLTNHLRFVGNEHIEVDYVNEYLSGNASFGCFFPQLRDFLRITGADVFRKNSPEEAQRNLESLDKYLTDCSNPDSLVIFLKYKPGEELRKHVAEVLTEKREKAMNKPYHSVEVGLNPDEETNRYMKNRLRLKKFLIDFISDLEKRVQGESILLLPEKAGENIGVSAKTNPAEALYRAITMIVEDKEESEGYFGTKVIPGSRIIVQQAFKRGRKGFTVDFLFPDGDYFDRLISEGDPVERCSMDHYMGLDAWREAYTKGTFSTIKDRQRIADLGFSLSFGMDELIPLREPTKAERYEIHQRWAWAGGSYSPGENTKGPQEIERQMNNKPDPVGRSEFEETAYQINSDLTIIMGLFDQLTELVEEKPLLKK